MAAIRAELTASPFVGEGHRKVWAQLRILSGILAAKDRVCRQMRENALLSPIGCRRKRLCGTMDRSRPKHRTRCGAADGIRIQTVQDGWVFSTVDRFDACCVGIHAVKIGNRFAAVQPMAQGLKAEFDATAGKGLKLRMDHGTQYTAGNFLKQIEL